MEQERIWDHFQADASAAFEAARPRYQAMIRAVQSYGDCSGNRRVLNIGIGAGGVEEGLAALRWTVSSLDPSLGPVERLKRLGLDAHQGYAQKMPFDDKVFDAVVASEVLEHLTSAERSEALSEIARVLQTGGVFVGSVPFQEQLLDNEAVCPSCGLVFHRWGHTESFDRRKLIVELERQFKVAVCRPRAFVLWGEARGARAFARTVVKWALGRMGEGVVAPSLFFVARL